MKTKLFILSCLLGCAVTVTAQSSDAVFKDKITQAVMKVYNDQMAKNPNDYNTLFARANQYYYNGDYGYALGDVDRALTITPAKDEEMVQELYILRARIHDAMGDYTAELADLQTVQAMNPTSLAITDLMAKANLNGGDLVKAEEGFNSILRTEPLNYDAMYGLAQVEVKRGNQQAAIDHVDKACQLFTAEPQVYLNRADIWNQIGQPESAAQDYINAMCVGNDQGRGMQALVDMSNTNYDAAMTALGNSIEKTPRIGTFYYLRAALAMNHLHYGQALKDYRAIIDNALYDEADIYYNAAVCQYELTQYDDALLNIDKAIAKDPNQIDYYLQKSLIELYRGRGNNYQTAMDVLNTAASINPQSVEMLTTKASLLLAQDKGSEALTYLNAALNVNPDAEDALMMRGKMHKYSNSSAAQVDFERVAANNSSALRGFALHELGRDSEANQWCQQLVGNVVPGGEAYYYAAALMGEMGKVSQGIDYLKNALSIGFGSLQEVNVNKLPYLNLATLRGYAGFRDIVDQYQSNFQER